MSEAEAKAESVGTVVVAGAANLAIAVAKLVAGLISGSAAMLSEAAHSLADTTTEVLLYLALRRGARPADRRHPFGYGKESYVWAFLAALFTFVVGAGFAITHGVTTILVHEHTGNYRASYLVLAISFVIESVSLARAIRQVRRESRRWRSSPHRYLRLTPDTTVKAVFLEDSAALVGLLIAGVGLGLSELTADELYDGIASILIGVLLLVVAGILARSNISLLVGRAVSDRVHRRIEEELEALPEVDRVDTLMTMLLGPEDILVAAKVDFCDDATAADIEAAADEAERRLTEHYPEIAYVFLDPTRSMRGPEGHRARPTQDENQRPVDEPAGGGS
ncbi:MULTISPECIES: cation diffusion facilitator family transporter [Micromonospora]|uniref:Cation diffusion facilitator family transporter n=1 Tax=Micromonospora solifontis TaxID=2487138 RepID=A0ABX9WLR1_9ACTN|nr:MULTISPECIES: cation diffusion facilitator family transporter [Micromonospora]NES13129.1 cation diffusion facilitator family transporter [Micromonospora sp. PPF5-17B]NES36306.1 cation diffusion facilitator family transporter [Micromonospora solifontis]NES55054.1 cation diffusion facilitator family transporter [Micromonospora sp. PPF5-6]RNL99710.1 cation diffusion facilitator family transporter [Micromonospora solifontis]